MDNEFPNFLTKSQESEMRNKTPMGASVMQKQISSAQTACKEDAGKAYPEKILLSIIFFTEDMSGTFLFTEWGMLTQVLPGHTWLAEDLKLDYSVFLANFLIFPIF